MLVGVENWEKHTLILRKKKKVRFLIGRKKAQTTSVYSTSLDKTTTTTLVKLDKEEKKGCFDAPNEKDMLLCEWNEKPNRP